MQELSKLAEKDPEFYKYLQENDRELLEFDPTSADVDDAMEGEYGGEEMETVPILTRDILKSWQKALLEVQSFPNAAAAR
jgi:nucleolar complex protein 2